MPDIPDTNNIKRVPPEALSAYRSAAEGLRDIILSNLVMIGEIPAPTFGENKRIEQILYRFNEAGLQQCSADELGNGMGLLPGEVGEDAILLVAHADSVFDDDVNHTIAVEADRVTGCGLRENSLALAVLASLPALLEKLQIRLKSNLIFVAAVRSLGRGNLEGIRYFLANNKHPIKQAICLESTSLGKLCYTSIGMLRGEITCKVSGEYNWTRFGACGAVLTMNQVIARIAGIPLPSTPATTIVLGSMEAGNSYGEIALQALLRFEILSEAPDIVDKIERRIKDILVEVSSQTGAELKFDAFARRTPGGLIIGDPLVLQTRQIMEGLSIIPSITPSTSELSAFIDQKIPSVTVAVSTGESLTPEKDAIMINPIFTGVAQIMGLLTAIDEGGKT